MRVERIGQPPAKLTSNALNDCCGRHAAATAHRLQAVAGAGGFQRIDQRRHQARAGSAERAPEDDGATVDIDLLKICAKLL